MSTAPAVLSGLRNWIRGPVLEHAEDTVAARALNRIMLATAAVFFVFHGLLVLNDPSTALLRLQTLGVVAALTVAVLELNRRGRTRLASWLMIAGLASILAVRAFTSGGVRAPALSGFIIVVMAGGLLLGTRGGAIVACALAAVDLAMAVAEVRGALPPPQFNFSPIAIWLFHCMWLGLAVIYQDRISSVLGGALKRTRRELRERVQTQEQARALAAELATERSHLVAAQSVARMGSWATDLSDMSVTWSAETHRIFETDPATFAPTHERFLERVHPADREAVDRTFIASLNSATTQSISHRVTTSQGRVKFVEEAWRVTQGDDGTPLRAVGTIHDVTERKEAEERVRASDARLHAVLKSAPVVIVAVDSQGLFTLSEGRGLEALGLTPGQLVGQAVADLYADIEIALPDGVNISFPEAVRRVLSGTSVTGLTKVGSEYFATHLVPDRGSDGRLTAAIGVSTVVTARHLAELRVQHLNRVYAMLSGINETIVRENDPRKMLDSACRLAVERGQFAMAWIGLLDETGTMPVTAHAGADADTVELITRLIGSTEREADCPFTASAMSTGQSGICNDIANDPGATTWRTAAQERGWGSMASLPLKERGAVIGTFNLYARSPWAFDTEELRLLDELAMDISFGLEVREREKERLRIDRALRDSEARLRRSIAELQAVSARLNEAREQERLTMARDIHDHLGQALTALKMDVAEVQRRLDVGDTVMVRERMTEMSQLLDSAMDDVRRVAAELRPVVLDDLGFVDAVRAYLIDIERRTHLRCVLHTPLTDLAIANNRATALFRILQEALTNVIRHAGATRVDISLTVDADCVRLIVHDDGRGIPAGAALDPRALGIIGMRDRARLFGGDVVVTGGAGEGTTVTVDLPLTEASA